MYEMQIASPTSAKGWKSEHSNSFCAFTKIARMKTPF